MQITTISYFDGETQLLGKRFCPDNTQTKNLPTIILFHAFEGLGDFTENYAKNIAEKGYTVFAADMYGNGETANTIDGCFRLITPFLQDRSLVRRRAVLAYETATEYMTDAERVSNTVSDSSAQRIGAMGFCFGGMCTLELARSGANLRAAVGAHSIIAPSDLPTHPIQADLLLLQGYADPQVPPSQLPTFAEEMKKASVKDWSVVFFGYAQHSFTDPATGTYDPEKEKEMGRVYDPLAAQRTFRYAMDFFDEKLGR